MNSEEIMKAVLDAMMHGEGVVRIDPLKMYKRPSLWRRVLSWFRR
jgi:hypothetical protein